MCPNGSCSEESGLSQVTDSATFTFLMDTIFYNHPHTKFKFTLVCELVGGGKSSNQRRGSFQNGVILQGFSMTLVGKSSLCF